MTPVTRAATLADADESGDVAGRLPGLPLPNLALPSSAGGTVQLRASGPLAVVFVYPMTGRPGVPLPAGWDEIPGARGCTAEAQGFRDRHGDLEAAGVRVYGLSSQAPEHQREAALRLQLSYPLLSDARLELAERMWLPTFEIQGLRLYRRLTLVVANGVVQHVFHPVDRPEEHAGEVLRWLAYAGERYRTIWV